jgi:hypothetical protein
MQNDVMPKVVLPIEQAPAEVAEWAKTKLAAACAEHRAITEKIDSDPLIVRQPEILQAFVNNSHAILRLGDFVKSFVSPEAAYEIIDGPNWENLYLENKAPSDPTEFKVWAEKQITEKPV